MSTTLYTLTTLADTVGHWRFKGNFLDISPSGSHMTTSGITAGDYTTGYTEPGTTSVVVDTPDYGVILAANASDLDMGASDFTIEFIAKVVEDTANGICLSKLSTSGYSFYYLTTGWHLEVSDLSTTRLVQATGFFDDDTYHYIAFVVDRSGEDELRAYIDGSFVNATDMSAVTGDISASGADFDFECSESGITWDEICITKRTLTAAEIATRAIIHGDSLQFNYSGSASLTTNTASRGLNAFDVKLRHPCNHNLSTGQFILNTCSRCLGTGYYYDIKFNAYGRPETLSIENKLQQALEKMVLTPSNNFHESLFVDIQSHVGQLQEDIEPIIAYDIQQIVAAMKHTHRSVVNLSPSAQIFSLDSIEVIKEGQTSLRYIVKITTVAGDEIEVIGDIDLVP